MQFFKAYTSIQLKLSQIKNPVKIQYSSAIL